MRAGSAQLALPGILSHDIPVRNSIGAADLNNAIACARKIQRSDKIIKQIFDAYGLRGDRYPSRANHHRQALDQRPDYFKRKASRADDDGGAKLDDLDTRRTERCADFLTAAQMRRQRARAQAAEINDAPNISRLGSRRKN